MLEETLLEYSFLCFVLKDPSLSSISPLCTVPYWIMSPEVQLFGDLPPPLRA
jgi:hypothetical protein